MANIIASRIHQYIVSYLSMSSGYQWLLYLPLLTGIIFVSGLQQYWSMIDESSFTEQQTLVQQRKNIVLINRIKSLKKNSLPQSSILSNDQIADKFQSWSNEGKAEIVTLGFYGENYDSNLRATQIKGELLVNASDLFMLLDKELGESLFIESLSLRRYDRDRMKLNVQLIQPKAELQ